jgi:2-hydroxy-3-keto-5-methylthiopentenyl-1-phosphate phosphatase
MTTGKSFRIPSPDPQSGQQPGRHPAPAVLTDFDDTAAAQNVAELLLDRFGHASWHEVRQRFRDGKVTLKEYQEITFNDIQADRDAMRGYVMENASFRPYFRELWDYCQARDIPMAIVSHGLDFYIDALLEKFGIFGMPIYAVDATFTPQGLAYQYNFPYPGQEHLGNSKGLVVDRFRDQGYHVFYAGDGASDLEAAERADVVFAHRTLAKQCGERQIPFQEFNDFQGMLRAVQGYSENGRRPS